MKRYLYKFLLFAFVLLAIAYHLSGQYVGAGEVAQIIYYRPLTIYNYAVIMGIEIVALALSNVFFRVLNRKVVYFEVFIYLALFFALYFFGNDFLELREIDWPHTYHPTQWNG